MCNTFIVVILFNAQNYNKGRDLSTFVLYTYTKDQYVLILIRRAKKFTSMFFIRKLFSLHFYFYHTGLWLLWSLGCIRFCDVNADDILIKVKKFIHCLQLRDIMYVLSKNIKDHKVLMKALAEWLVEKYHLTS